MHRGEGTEERLFSNTTQCPVAEVTTVATETASSVMLLSGSNKTIKLTGRLDQSSLPRMQDHTSLM